MLLDAALWSTYLFGGAVGIFVFIVTIGLTVAVFKLIKKAKQKEERKDKSNHADDGKENKS